MADSRPLLYRRVVTGSRLNEWLWGEQRRQWLAATIAELKTIPSRTELYSSTFWRTERGKLDEFLCSIQTGGPEKARPDSPPLPAAVARRIVMWNVLKGISFDSLVNRLTHDARLARADVLLLNEIDIGMARSENRHVAAALAERLGMYWAFVPSYLELTKGLGSDLVAPGENTVSLHGVAILSREKPIHLAAVPLPDTFDVFTFHEKRLGQRTALLATFASDGTSEEGTSEGASEGATEGDGGSAGELTVGTAHLEVRGVPAGRAAQVTAVLGGIKRYGEVISGESTGDLPVLFGGDFNTHTFSRGGFGRSLRAFLTLLLSTRSRRRERLMTPWRGGHEPLFARLREAGYDWESLNDPVPTAWAPIHAIEEGDRFGQGLKRLIGSLISDDSRGVALHLDWFFGRQVRPLTGTKPQVLAELIDENPPSDHAPILIDLEICR